MIIIIIFSLKHSRLLCFLSLSPPQSNRRQMATIYPLVYTNETTYLHRVDGDGESRIVPGHLGVGRRLIVLGTASSGADANHSKTDHQQQETGADHHDNGHGVA